MKSASQRGAIGAWAYQARQESGLSVEQVAERVGEMGVGVSPATIRGIESGNKRPAARLLRAIGKALDSTPPGEPGAAEPGDDLAAAVRDQTAALLAVIDRMDRRIDFLERLLVSGDRPDPQLVESWREWARDASAPARRLDPARESRPESR